MVGEGSHLAVRPYRPADYLKVRRVLTEGLMSLPLLAFRHALLSPVAPGLLMATGGAVYGASRSPALATLSVCGLLALLYQQADQHLPLNGFKSDLCVQVLRAGNELVCSLTLPPDPWEMAGEGPRLAVRPYRPADYLEVRRVLAEGLMSLPPLAFRRALLSPVAPGLLLATGGAVYRASHSPALATLSICGLLALLYLTCWEVYACYLRERLVDDMADVEGRYLRQEGAGFWVAEVEGMEGLGGVVAALPREGEGGSCELLRLSVDRRCRRLGVGRRLTAWVLDFARARGYRECVLETSSAQQPAVRLYRSLGFRLVRWDQPLPHPPLASRLTNVYLWEMRRALEEGEWGEGRGETR